MKNRDPLSNSPDACGRKPPKRKEKLADSDISGVFSTTVTAIYSQTLCLAHGFQIPDIESRSSPIQRLGPGSYFAFLPCRIKFDRNLTSELIAAFEWSCHIKPQK